LRKRFIYAGLCTLFGVLVVVALYTISNRINHRANGFVRLLPPHVADPVKIFDTQSASFYISGVTGNKVYLSHYRYPDFLMEVDVTTGDTMVHRLNIILGNKKLALSAKVFVDSPFIHIMDGTTGGIFKGGLGDGILRYDSAFTNFTASQPVSASSFVLRTVNLQLHRNVLLRQAGDSLAPHNDILQKQVDGIFCTDGTLSYDAAMGKLVYVYNYRNQLIYMDTALQVLYRGRTIDTISQVKLKVDTIRSENKVTISSPPLTVNKQTCISNGLLFIHSALKANNEDTRSFDRASVIDVYNLNSNGKYLCSFYLPDYMGKKIRDFRVVNDHLVAQYDHWLYIYKLRFPKKIYSK